MVSKYVYVILYELIDGCKMWEGMFVSYDGIIFVIIIMDKICKIICEIFKDKVVKVRFVI